MLKNCQLTCGSTSQENLQTFQPYIQEQQSDCQQFLPSHRPSKCQDAHRYQRASFEENQNAQSFEMRRP